MSIIKLERQSPMFSLYGFIDFFFFIQDHDSSWIDFCVWCEAEVKSHFSIWISNCSSTISPIKLQGLTTIFSSCYWESISRQVDKKSWGPQGERGLEFSRRRKGQTFFPPLHSVGLYNNHVFCLRTTFGKNHLANPVILKYKLWEWI